MVKKLLSEAKAYAKNDSNPRPFRLKTLFKDGAFWMFERMQIIDFKENRKFDTTIPFNFYGYLKYLICCIFFSLSIFYIYDFSIIISILLSAFSFYIAEVSFLFLFPILIDEQENPLYKSIKMTYQIGYIKCVFTVMPIAFFMLLGLLNCKNPLKNWYIGCWAILVWYYNAMKSYKSD